MCNEISVVVQSGGEFLDVERAVEAGAKLPGVDKKADLSGLASE
jgi:hypothetical protein